MGSVLLGEGSFSCPGRGGRRGTRASRGAICTNAPGGQARRRSPSAPSWSVPGRALPYQESFLINDMGRVSRCRRTRPSTNTWKAGAAVHGRLRRRHRPADGPSATRASPDGGRRSSWWPTPQAGGTPCAAPSARSARGSWTSTCSCSSPRPAPRWWGTGSRARSSSSSSRPATPSRPSPSAAPGARSGRSWSFAPRTPRSWRAARSALVPVAELVPGQVVRVRPGDRIPVDGVVVGGLVPGGRVHAHRRAAPGGQARRRGGLRGHAQRLRLARHPGDPPRRRHRAGARDPPGGGGAARPRRPRRAGSRRWRAATPSA